MPCARDASLSTGLLKRDLAKRSACRRSRTRMMADRLHSRERPRLSSPAPNTLLLVVAEHALNIGTASPLTHPFQKSMSRISRSLSSCTLTSDYLTLMRNLKQCPTCAKALTMKNYGYPHFNEDCNWFVLTRVMRQWEH